MITNVDQVMELVSEAIDGKVYLGYPQQKISKSKPYAVLTVNSVPYLKDREGRDVQSLLTYNIRLHGKGQRDLLSMADAISEKLAPYKLRCLGMTPMWSDPAYGPMSILTYELLLDRRGNTFTLG